MAGSILSSRPSDDFSNVGRSQNELPESEVPLLHGHKAELSKRKLEGARWTQLALFVWAVVATAGAITLGVLNQGRDSQTAFPPSGKRNVIFMVSDGMGPTSLHVTRSWLQYRDNLPYNETLFLDKHLIGTSRTRSSNSLVTDSAAGATAFSCGKKSYNGAIAVLPDHSPCGTVLEAASKAGYKTGLVVTTRLTDATPACFSAHVNMRSEEARIAEQQIGDYPLGRMVDLMLGGGRCYFLPQSAGDQSCRQDERDIVLEAQTKHGFSYVSDRAGFDSLQHGKNISLPLLGLFARTDIPFDIDRKDEDYPALWEMAEAAITALSDATKDSDKGFFIMVEGSRIDHAGHGNDPVAQVREVLAYDKTFRKMVEWAEKSDVQTVVVSTSDHETGGLAAARQLHGAYPEYLWYPSALENATHSADFLAAQLANFPHIDDDKKLDKFIRQAILAEGLGIFDASKEEIQDLKNSKMGAGYALADIVSRRAQIGWSTHGHSAVDVNIYGIGAASSKLSGNHENTEVGNFLKDYLELDLDAVTQELLHGGVKSTMESSSKLSGGPENALKDSLELDLDAFAQELLHGGVKSTMESHRDLTWMGRTLEDITDNPHWVTDQMDCYHGEFKREVKGVLHPCGPHQH